MAEEFFEPVAMTDESMELVDKMRNILNNYRTQGYDLSLRQLYYQLVSQNIVPNTERSYKRVGGILSDARLAGHIDWDMIVDRGRTTEQNAHWNSPADIIRTCAKQFRFDTWNDQPWHVEVMVEKQALEGVLLPVCRNLDIPFTANKGYSSSSAMRECGKRIADKLDAGKNICVVYLGDHDPSGIDMTRDVEDRLKLFSGYKFYQPNCDQKDEKWDRAYKTMNKRLFKLWKNKKYSGQELIVERAALNMDQIEQYQPPPNPAKTTDSRSKSYISAHGNESWELDALEPTVLAQIVEEAVAERRDDGLWNAADDIQIKARRRLQRLADNWRDDINEDDEE